MKIALLIWGFGLSALAQNFAVLLAKDDATAPAGYPTNWPVQVQPIGSLTNLPPQFRSPWIFATKAQVEKWKADHQEEMDAFRSAQEAATTQPKRDRETVIRQAIDNLKLIRDSSGTLTAAQLSNAVRELAKTLLALIEELRP